MRRLPSQQRGLVDTRWGIRGWHVCCRGVRGRGFGLRVLTPSASFACPTVAGRRILRPRSLAHDVHARLGTEPSSGLASGGAEPLPRLVCSGLQRLGQGSLKARGQLRELRSRRMALRAELTEHLHVRGVAERGISCPPLYVRFWGFRVKGTYIFGVFESRSHMTIPHTRFVNTNSEGIPIPQIPFLYRQHGASVPQHRRTIATRAVDVNH